MEEYKKRVPLSPFPYALNLTFPAIIHKLFALVSHSFGDFAEKIFSRNGLT